MKTKYITLLAAAAFVSNSYGATLQGGTVVDFSGSLPEAVILDAGGTPISSGFYGVGYFTISDTAVQDAVTVMNFGTLNMSFVQLASDDFQTGVPNLIGPGATPGLASLNNTGFDPTPGIGSTLYTYITDSTALGGSTSYALYQHNGVVLAADPVNPPATEYTTLIQNGTLLVGTAGGPLSMNVTDVGSVNFAQTIQLTAIPEPSALLLSAFGVLGLLRRKR